MDVKPPKILVWLVFIAVMNGFILALILLPTAPLPGLVALAAVVTAAWRSRMNLGQVVIPPLRRLWWLCCGGARVAEDVPMAALTWTQAAGELALVCGVALALTLPYLTSDTRAAVAGGEAEWLTSSAHFASRSLREYGYIPLWQPYLEFGEPLIDQPFSFVLNPISTLPSLLYGGVQGIKYSVVLYAMVAGVGGWFLGRMLGLGALGRVLLGLLLLGKGNMHAMIGTGYYQLGVTQAYFPWIIGGMVGVLRARGRWPVVLTALMFTLMFWAGNIWYTLPVLVSLAFLALVCLPDHRRLVDWPALRRLLLVALLTFGLSAITFLPIFAHHDHIGGHLNEWHGGSEAGLGFVISQFFDGSLEPYFDQTTPGGIQFYYSFVTPLWFVVLIVVVCSPIFHFLRRPAGRWRIWAAGLLSVVFATLWGAGGHPLFVWLYAHVPLLGQWRFVGRALALASFWIAVLVALRVDELWRVFIRVRWGWRFRRISPRVALTGGLIAASALAAGEVVGYWPILARPAPVSQETEACLAWLRRRYPDRPLTAYRLGYEIVTGFLDNDIRLFNIEADYFPLPLDSTIGRLDLLGMNNLPEFAISGVESTRMFLRENGYRPLRDSPESCVWRKPVALSYAFRLPLSTAVTAPNLPLDPGLTTPITTLARLPDRVALRVTIDSDDPQVITVQEVAYPGWQARLDGAPVPLTVFGGQVAVIMPPENGAVHLVEFQYQPPLFYLGRLVTLAAWMLCVLYLLRAERLLGRRAR